MKAVIIAVGDELVSGRTVDTNSAYMADRLARLGIETLEHATVGDNVDAIADAIARGAGRADVVLISGGLGPTADDLTRHGIAKVMGAELRLDEASLAEIERFFQKRGRKMVPANQIQAMVPVGAEAMENRAGTAPGIAAEIDGAKVYVTPGVPHEMRWMFENVIAPRLTGGGRVILHHVVHTFGMGESDISQLIGDLMADRSADTTVGTTVKAGMVSARITVRAEGRERAEADLAAMVAELRRRLGTLVVGEGEGEDAMAEAVGDLLRRAGQTLATAESCTGGQVGGMITAVSGASDYYLGGIVSYANAVKSAHLGVAPALLAAEGAVSEPVARAMADGCRLRLGSTWALALTGIAGPTGGSDEKPVGTVYIALAGPGGTDVQRHVLPGDRRIIRRRAALAALNTLRMALLAQADVSH